MSFWAVLALPYLAVFAVVLVLGSRRPLGPATRARARGWALGWIGLASAEYWLLGPYSLVHAGPDVEFLASNLFLVRHHDGGVFAHAFAGGNDIYGFLINGGQYVSLERLIVDLLPPWASNAVHKVLVISVGFTGTYLLCRRTGGAGHTGAFALAALFTLSHQRVLTVTWAHGMGFALVPLAVYLCVGRHGRRHYFAGVLAIALVNAISSSPTHSNLALFGGVGLAGFMFGLKRLAHTLPALLILAAALLANWHESLYAKAVLAPESFRGTAVSVGELKAITGLIGIPFVGNGYFWAFAIPAVLGAALLFRGHRRLCLRGATAVAVGFVGGTLIQFFPWQEIGLKMLGGFHFSNMGPSAITLALLLCALGLSAREAAGGSSWASFGRVQAIVPSVAVLLLALAFAKLAWYKTYNSVVWLSKGGGLSAYLGAPDHVDTRAWPPRGPARMISVPFRLSNNMAAAVGIETADGLYNVQARGYALFWKRAAPKSSPHGGYVIISDGGGDSTNPAGYEFARDIDPDFLRIANVGHILSIVPLTGEGISQVSGPEGEVAIPSDTASYRTRLIGYLKLVFAPAPLRVYALPPPLPRVFAARDVVVVPDRTTGDEFYRTVLAHAPSRTVVARQADLAPGAAAAAGALRVRRFTLVRDGFEIELDAEDGGLVVLNTPYYSFWHATADGRVVAVFPVNGIHTAISVPPGARRLSVRWNRKLLRDRVLDAVVR